MKTATK